jgi:lincosamide nucleotidyltransferase A/C/D/E
MDAPEVLRLVQLLQARGITVWLDGGWGVDALLEEQVREHDDLDLVVEVGHVAPLIEVMTAAGYQVVAGGAPKSFVLVDAIGRQVDVHPVLFDEDRGGGVYLMEDESEWVYPSPGFTGRGRVNGHSVHCLSPQVQVLVHSGYTLTEKDYSELDLLHARFGVELPRR